MNADYHMRNGKIIILVLPIVLFAELAALERSVLMADIQFSAIVAMRLVQLAQQENTL